MVGALCNTTITKQLIKHIGSKKPSYFLLASLVYDTDSPQNHIWAPLPSLAATFRKGHLLGYQSTICFSCETTLVSGRAINSARPHFLPVTFPWEMLLPRCRGAQLTYPEFSALVRDHSGSVGHVFGNSIRATSGEGFGCTRWCRSLQEVVRSWLLGGGIALPISPSRNATPGVFSVVLDTR